MTDTSASDNKASHNTRTDTTIDPETLRLAAMLRGTDPHAVEVLADFGPGYWNPLIHADDEKTFEHIEQVMHLLHDLLNSDKDIDEIRPGITLVARTVWAAAQYECNSRAAARTA
jgi:predicted peptidase